MANLVTETLILPCDSGIAMVAENLKAYMINFKSILSHAIEK